MKKISTIFSILLLFFFVSTSVQAALVDISIESAASTVNIGDSFAVGVWLLSDAPGTQVIRYVSVNLDWDKGLMQLNSIDEGASYDWPSFDTLDLSSADEPDPSPNYSIWGVGAQGGFCPSTDLLFATLNFMALAQTESAGITIAAQGGPATLVYSGLNNVTGSFTNGSVIIISEPATTSGSVIIIPEPATFCLLGLACLMHCRRKCA